MAEETDVRLLAWPAEPAQLQHRGSAEEPVELRVGFAPDSPAAVVLRTDPEGSLDVRMTMQVRAEEPVPLCIRVCEPICVTSEYRIAVDIFDRPVMSVTVRGTTRFAECDEEPR
jgi:hypothetical protein